MTIQETFYQHYNEMIARGLEEGFATRRAIRLCVREFGNTDAKFDNDHLNAMYEAKKRDLIVDEPQNVKATTRQNVKPTARPAVQIPEKEQIRLDAKRRALANKVTNTPYRVEVYNEDGTRYFIAQRRCIDWSDDKGHSMPFGGGTYWVLYYGEMQARIKHDALIGDEYVLCYVKLNADCNGVTIPTQLATKKEVIELVKKLGIFNI